MKREYPQHPLGGAAVIFMMHRYGRPGAIRSFPGGPGLDPDLMPTIRKAEQYRDLADG